MSAPRITIEVSPLESDDGFMAWEASAFSAGTTDLIDTATGATTEEAVSELAKLLPHHQHDKHVVFTSRQFESLKMLDGAITDTLSENRNLPIGVRPRLVQVKEVLRYIIDNTEDFEETEL